MSTDHGQREGSSRLLFALLGLLAAVALAAGCGDDEDSGSGSGEISTREVPGQAVAGTGYAYALPDGWSVEGESSSGPDVGIDTLIVGKEARSGELVLNINSGDFVVNITVLRDSEIPGDTLIDAYVNSGIQQVQDAPGSFALPDDATVELVSDPAPTDLGGENALDYELLFKGEGIAASQRRIAAIHEGTAYTITLSAPEGALEEHNAALDEIAGSWSWS